MRGSALALLLLAAPALALDPFEIQVYDGTANAPGVAGLELHANTVARGLRTGAGPELPQDKQLHLTLEPSLGLFPWWELGAYLQTAYAAGAYRYAGVKLRSKFVSPPRWGAGLRLGANFELSVLPQAFDQDRWGGEVRPIVAFEDAHVLAAVNPIVGVSLAGPGLPLGPTFEPAATLLVKLFERAALGLEYYGDLGPIAHPAPAAEQAHYLFQVVSVLAVPGFELNAGVGVGLTPGSNPFVAKMILGYAFDRTPLWRPRVTAARSSPGR